MSSPEELLTEMTKTLHDLVNNARQMVQVSSQEFSQTEISTLQERQNALVSNLAAIDAQLNRDYPTALSDKISPVVQLIEKEIEHFEGLNADFLDNVRRHGPVIQFESDKAHRSQHRKEPPSKEDGSESNR